MKRYKSFILFGALALSFAACNTDDLEQNIDALETRVQGVEAQVQALNNNMNVIRVLLDGNKTIQTATKAPDGTWTLLLSNGETLTLTPGNTDDTTYPVIEISDDGYWVIEGVKSERRAKAEDGKAADITPQFQIVAEGGGKVWQVSYDEGTTWEYVTDETGARVSATGAGAGTNPIASAEVEGNNFKITLTDGGDYTIPIVKDLVCQITDPVDMENGKWYVDRTESFTVTVSEGSDVIARVVVPAEWDATISESGAERTVSVTAPSTPSECILVVEVTKGVNTVTDEIVVRTNVTADGYYADFMAGLDIQIGNVKINKKMFGEDVTIKHVTADESIEDGLTEVVYFVDGGKTLTLARSSGSGTGAAGGFSSLVIIGNDSQEKSTLKLSTKNNYVSLRGSDGGLGLLMKNIIFDNSVRTNNYALNVEGNISEGSTATYKNIVFDGCKLNSSVGSFCRITNTGTNIRIPVENVAIYNSVIKLGVNTNIFNVDGSVHDGWKNAALVNNVFYSPDGSSYSLGVLNFNVTSNVFDNLTVDSNTFINTTGGNGFVRMCVQNASIGNNLVWKSNSTTATFVNFVKKDGVATAWDVNAPMNLAYGEGLKWIGTGSTYYSPEGTSVNTGTTTTDPFDSSAGGVLDYENEIFKTSTGIGANIE